MQTRTRRIVPLRPPAAGTPPGQDCARAGSATRERLQATFTGFYNALFDAACLANDEQRHERTLQLLRAVKAREPAIIDGICADLARSGAPGEKAEARDLERALALHCAVLTLEPGEQALLEAAFAGQMAAPDKRAPAAKATPAMADEQESAARLVARLRAVGLELEPAGAADGADYGPPGSVEPQQAATAMTQPARPRIARRAVALAMVALVLIALSALFLGPMGTEILLQAPPAARLLPAPAPQAASVAADETQQEAPTERSARGPALTAGDPAPVTEPAPAPEQPPAEAGRALEAPAVAAQVEAITAAAQDVPPADAARLATQVDYLLRRGDAALAALRLSEPFADSAAANYTAALAIDAQNAEARLGLERIVEIYGRLARAALQRGDAAYAQQLLARARTVLPESAALRQLEQEIANSRLAGH